MAPGTGSLLLAGEHFGAALAFLVAGAMGLVWIAPDLAAGLYLSPRVAGVTHLFTLGWITTTIFGALHQLLPVALGAPAGSGRLSHAGFWSFVPGVAIFAAGVATSRTLLYHAGLALVAVGMLLTVGNFGASLLRARDRGITWTAIALGLAFLTSVLGLGVILEHNLHTAFLGEARVRVLAIHLHIALVGWALLVIVGMAQRLMPMFLLAHGVDARWTRYSVFLLGSGVAVLASGLALRVAPVEWTGVALLEAGVACFIAQVRGHFAARVRRKLDAAMHFAVVSLVFLSASALLGPAVLAAGPARPRLAVAYVLLGLLGGIGLFVIGQLYKILPFLAWLTRFRAKMGREKVPTVAELYSSRVAYVQLVLMSAGVAGMAGGVAAGSANVTRWAACFFFLGTVLLVSQAGRATWGTPA